MYVISHLADIFNKVNLFLLPSVPLKDQFFENTLKRLPIHVIRHWSKAIKHKMLFYNDE